MPSLRKELRSQLEKSIVAARRDAEAGAREALAALAVGEPKPFDHLSKNELKLRVDLRAHGRAVGDQRDKTSGRQTTNHLKQAVAYEHWHRMLFARFLAENGCLLEPSSRVAVSLADLDELARDEHTDVWTLAGRYAAQMLPQIFRPDDPALALTLPPETRQSLEKLLTGLPTEVFLADDSLGWVYQFWQTEAKKAANESEEKIGADTLSAVTQLFTEDYMVDFMLHNTLGAWHAGKVSAATPLTGDTENALRVAVALPGQSWNYLRWVKSESDVWSPAAGTFASWPRRAAELTVLDPCMGSGHFLVAALPVLARLRMAEEDLSPAAAARAALRDNLHGLELDPRCAQLAGFNLALAAWKFAPDLLLETAPLTLHLACCGLQLQGSEAEWQAIAQQTARRSRFGGGDQLFTDKESLNGPLEDRVVIGMRALHDLFSQAPVLGSLIDPRRALAGEMALFTGWDELSPLLQQALAGEQSGDAESHELAVQVQGLAKAAELLAGQFHLVITNVPYLARGKQCPILQEFGKNYAPNGKMDLATVFLHRCRNYLRRGGVASVVTPQNWLFLSGYTEMREDYLQAMSWLGVGRLGPGAFETITGEIVNTSLVILGSDSPHQQNSFLAIDASSDELPSRKAQTLKSGDVSMIRQSDQLKNPDSRIVLVDLAEGTPLRRLASALSGCSAGDGPRFIRLFWEVPENRNDWEYHQSTVPDVCNYGGRAEIIFWEKERGEMHRLAESVKHLNHAAQNWLRGKPNWKKIGVVVSQMGHLPTTIYLGDIYDCNCCAIVPNNPEHLPALWAFCVSGAFTAEVRKINQKLNVTPGTLLDVPFDLAHWQRIAAEKYPSGLPKPHSDDPTQWLFNGRPKGSEQPLHVAFARLLGYRWPRQTGSSFPDCPALGPDGLEEHVDTDGIVCLTALRGERTATDRLNCLLSAALGSYDEHALIAATGSKARNLEDWLRDEAFEQHCKLFHHRPFIWHIWDGRADGFHAFVNYHQLAAPNGAGRKLLETLLYSYLGDWIRKQQDDAKRSEPGAEDRLIAAQALQKELEAILAGEPPYDLFIRWKPLHQQPIGWEPDINDGVRVNIRPFLAAKDVGRKGAGILRFKPNVKWDKDRGKEPMRPKADYPWFWTWDEKTENFAGGADFDGNRWNDCHYTPAFERAARERQTAE